MKFSVNVDHPSTGKFGTYVWFVLTKQAALLNLNLQTTASAANPSSIELVDRLKNVNRGELISNFQSRPTCLSLNSNKKHMILRHLGTITITTT